MSIFPTQKTSVFFKNERNEKSSYNNLPLILTSSLSPTPHMQLLDLLLRQTETIIFLFERIFKIEVDKKSALYKYKLTLFILLVTTDILSSA